VTWEYERIAPTLDGKPRIFLRRKDAEDYAYDYQIAGGRNQSVEYRKEPLSAEAKAAGIIYRAWEELRLP
jgi:hypothetical protein